jgi:hypothetical protein
VKHLTSFTTEFWLRVGDYRVLFEVEGGSLVLYRVMHRGEAYRWRGEGAMMTRHPEILVKDGKKQFAVLPYEKFMSLKERLEDMEDLLQLRKAKKAEGRKRTVPLPRAKRILGLK